MVFSCVFVSWNYLRVRGEYWADSMPMNACVELPPRTRRIPVSLIERLLDYGTTSAYAENTQYISEHLHGTRNYLRVRGEYTPRFSGQ